MYIEKQTTSALMIIMLANDFKERKNIDAKPKSRDGEKREVNVGDFCQNKESLVLYCKLD